MRQLVQTQTHEVETESGEIPGIELRVSRVGLGTWAMGGWMWDGTSLHESSFHTNCFRSLATSPSGTESRRCMHTW
jgi:hypothetical protein